MNQTQGTVRLAGFVLVIIGTLGLLFSEFILDAGRVVTLIFAAASTLGLLGLWYSFAPPRR